MGFGNTINIQKLERLWPSLQSTKETSVQISLNSEKIDKREIDESLSLKTELRRSQDEWKSPENRLKNEKMLKEKIVEIRKMPSELREKSEGTTWDQVNLSQAKSFHLLMWYCESTISKNLKIGFCLSSFFWFNEFSSHSPTLCLMVWMRIQKGEYSENSFSKFEKWAMIWEQKFHLAQIFLISEGETRFTSGNWMFLISPKMKNLKQDWHRV